MGFFSHEQKDLNFRSKDISVIVFAFPISNNMGLVLLETLLNSVSVSKWKSVSGTALRWNNVGWFVSIKSI